MKTSSKVKTAKKKNRTYIFGYTTIAVKDFVKKRAKAYKTISKYMTHLVKKDMKAVRG